MHSLEANGPANIILAIQGVEHGVRALDDKLLGEIKAEAERTIRYMNAQASGPKFWHEVE